jgi:hypothetical protein
MNKEEILIKCIDDIEAGICTLEECLAKNPEIADELRSLLDVTTRVQNLQGLPSTEFILRTKSHLAETMRLDIFRVEKKSGAFSWFGLLSTARKTVLVICCVLLVLLFVGSSTAYASLNSLPDESLYPIKRSLEKVQLTFTPGSENKANLYLDLSSRRVSEAEQLAILKRSIDSSVLESSAKDIDEAVKEINKNSLEIIKTFLNKLSLVTLEEELILSRMQSDMPEVDKETLAKSRETIFRGNLIAKVAYNNLDFLNNKPSVNDTDLDKSRFKVEGTLTSTEKGIWQIGGISISGIKNSQDAPPIGSTVEIEGIVYNNEVLIISIEYKQSSTDRVQVEGRYVGNTEDNTIWYIGSIPVGNLPNREPPLKDQEIKLDGILQNNKFVLTDLNDENKNDIEISGTLSNFNSINNTITVIHDGQQIIININQALIKTEDGHNFDLSNFIFTDGEKVSVEIEGLFQENNIIYAKLITLEFDEINLEQNESEDSDYDSEQEIESKDALYEENEDSESEETLNVEDDERDQESDGNTLDDSDIENDDTEDNIQEDSDAEKD